LKTVAIVVGVVAVLITLAICWRWDIGVLGGKYGIHGGWGFEIFVGVFAVLYVPIALIAKRRAKKSGGGEAAR
jgi:uncharacterized membrane protein